MPDKENFNCVLIPYGICSYDSNSMKSSNPHSGFYEAETSRTLDNNGGNPACNQGGVLVVEENKTEVTPPPAYGWYPQMKAECITFSEEKQPCLVIGTNPGFQNGVLVAEEDRGGQSQ